MNMEKLKAIPDGLLKDVSEDPEKQNQPETPGRSELSEAEVLKTGSHTENNAFPGFSGASETPEASGKDAPKKTPESGLFAVPGQSAGSIISGEFAVNILDIAFPALFVWGAGRMGYTMDKRHLQLNQSEREILAPAFQGFLDSIQLRMTPLQNLLLALSVVYGSKMMDKIDELKPKQKKPATAEKAAEVAAAAQEERELKRLALVKELKAMTPNARIAHLQKVMKLSKEKAKEWLNKNIQ